MLTKIIREWKLTVFLLVLVTTISFFLRTYNLNSVPIFADEAIYVRWSQVMRAEPTLRFVPVSDGKQPLFMWSVIPLLKVFDDPLVAGRVTSALAGTGTLIGVFALTYTLFKNKKVSLLASLIYAVSPYSVFFDRMALVDSMLTMFGVWTLVLGIITARTLRLDVAMITGFALGGALLTKSSALFYVILLPTTVLFTKFPSKKSERVLHLIKLGLLFVTVLIIGYAIYNVLRLGPNFHLITSRNQDYVFPINHFLSSPLDPFLPFIDRSMEWLSMLGPSSIIIFIVLAFVLNVKKYWKQVFVLSPWFLVPILIQSEFAKVFTARYIYFTIPYALILGATLLLWVTAKRKRAILRNFFYLGLAVFVLSALRIDYLILTNPEAAPLPRSERSGYLEEWTAGTGIREASEYLRNEYRNDPDQKIVVGTEGFFGTLPDGLQAYLNDLPEITVIGVGLDFTEIPSSLIESRDFGNKTYLLVNSSRLKINEDGFDKIGLEVIKSWKKADRPEGLREYVQHGQFDTLYLFEVR